MKDSYYHVVRLGRDTSLSYTVRDRTTSDYVIANRGAFMPVIGRWRVTNHAPLIVDLCGPMGWGR